MPQTSRFTRGLGYFGKLFVSTNLNVAQTFTVGSTASGASNSVFQNATVAVSSASILAMEATPVSILAAPGAGLAIVVDSIIFKMVATSTAYASGGAVSFVYHGGSVAAHSGSIPATVVNAGSAGTSYTQLGPPTATNGTTLTANTGIDITNATGAFTTGTGTAVVYIEYHIVTLP